MTDPQPLPCCRYPGCARPSRRARAGFCDPHYFQNRSEQIKAGTWKGRATSTWSRLSELARALDRKVREEHHRTHRWPSVDELALRLEGRAARRALILASWELLLAGLWAPAMLPVPRAKRKIAAKVARRRFNTVGGCLWECQDEPHDLTQTAQDPPSSGTENVQEQPTKSPNISRNCESGEGGSPAQPLEKSSD